MKKMEIKKIGIVSAFKATMYVMIIPLALFFIIGLLVTIGGAIARAYQVMLVGILYAFMPLIMLVIYGGMSMLIALIYNWLSVKFGGLEIHVEEKENSTSN